MEDKRKVEIKDQASVLIKLGHDFCDAVKDWQKDVSKSEQEELELILNNDKSISSMTKDLERLEERLKKLLL